MNDDVIAHKIVFFLSGEHDELVEQKFIFETAMKGNIRRIILTRIRKTTHPYWYCTFL